MADSGPPQKRNSKRPPRTLRLPSWLCASFESWAGPCHFDRFEMRSHERSFVKTMLAQRSNLWLFRTSQRRSCGDFIAIDMSSSRRSDRRAYVMELKVDKRLVIGGARLLCAQHRAADELAARGVLDDGSPVELSRTSADALVARGLFPKF